MTVAAVGTHCILEMCSCDSGLLNDEAFVRGAIERASEEGLSTLLKLESHRFDPHGVTAFGILAESHISIHTWPESGYAAVDVFTCGETAKPQQACEFLVRLFGSGAYSLREVARGAHIPSVAGAGAADAVV